MSEFLGHRFNDGKCINCRGIESSVRQFQTACQESASKTPTSSADPAAPIEAPQVLATPSAATERAPTSGNLQSAIKLQVAVVVGLFVLVGLFFGWRAVKGAPADNATITSTLERRLLASFPVNVLCAGVSPANDISQPTGLRGTTLRVTVQRSALRESPGMPPTTRATVIVSGSTTILWGVGMWRQAPPPMRCEFNQTLEVLLHQDEFGAWQAQRCEESECVAGLAHRL